MNTRFTVTCFKGKENEAAYTIDLGQDILAGMSDAERDKLAAAAKKVEIQGPLRTKESAADIEAWLKHAYPNATVEQGVVRQKSDAAIVKDLVKILGREKVEAMLKEAVEQQA